MQRCYSVSERTAHALIDTANMTFANSNRCLKTCSTCNVFGILLVFYLLIYIFVGWTFVLCVTLVCGIAALSIIHPSIHPKIVNNFKVAFQSLLGRVVNQAMMFSTINSEAELRMLLVQLLALFSPGFAWMPQSESRPPQTLNSIYNTASAGSRPPPPA